MNKRVLLGMSGGIDSSAAALILKEKGFDVVGVSIKFWEDNDPIFPDNKGITEAKSFCSELNVTHFIIDATKEFRDIVLNYFISEYQQGKTPFPCAKCNPLVKWKVLEKLANEHQCDFISTGHYVNTIDINDNRYILRGNDDDKDQSFFLWGVDQKLLKRAIFPLGEWKKNDIKAYLNDNGFPEFNIKKESTGVCFSISGDYRDLLEYYKTKNHCIDKPGEFKDTHGNFLGTHKGITHYTVGQRRGLGIDHNRAYYVCSLDPVKNEIILGSKNDLFLDTFDFCDYHVVNKTDFNERVTIIIRYRKQNHTGRVYFTSNTTGTVELDKPLDSIASGQTAVFFKENRVLGGAFIN